MLRDSRVLQSARDGGGGGGGGSGTARERPDSQPHGSDSEDDGEWEPGAYGLVDVPHKRSSYVRPAWMTVGAGASGRGSSSPLAASAAAGQAAAAARAPPPTPSRSSKAGQPLAGGGSSGAPASRRSLHFGMHQRPSGPGASFAFASVVPSASEPPQLRLFPGQLRASGKRLGTAAAAAAGASLVQRTDSSSSRGSSHGGDHPLAERCDSAAFGSELSFRGDE